MVDGGEVKTTFETRTFNHPNTTSETDLITFTSLKKLISIDLDLTNLAQDTTITVYNKVDGTNFRIKTIRVYPTQYNGAAIATVVFDGAGQDMKATLTSGTVEGAIRTIASDIRKENRE